MNQLCWIDYQNGKFNSQEIGKNKNKLKSINHLFTDDEVKEELEIQNISKTK